MMGKLNSSSTQQMVKKSFGKIRVELKKKKIRVELIIKQVLANKAYFISAIYIILIYYKVILIIACFVALIIIQRLY